MVSLCRTKTVAFLIKWNIIKLTEPNTPLNDADHVGSFLFPVSAKKQESSLEQIDLLPIMWYTIFRSKETKCRWRETNAISIGCRNCKKMEYIGA